MKKILDGVRVLDLTHAWFGPMCAMILGSMGAEVIKIEPPWGEISRFRPPLFNGAGTTFMVLNHDKKGMTLNLKTEKGLKIFKDLVKISDVVMQNFSPGTMESLGLGYDALRELNPGIIYAALSGFGQTGPWSRWRSFDAIGQAMSGFMSWMGEEVDPDGPPIIIVEAIGDTIPALWANIAIQGALRHRDKTGHGQMIDVAQADCMIAVAPSLLTYAMTGLKRLELREKYYTERIYDPFKASDGWVVIAAPAGRIFDRLRELIDTEEEEIKPRVEEWISTKTVEEALKLLVGVGVPCAPVLDSAGVYMNQHIQARNMLIEIEHPQAGKTRIPNLPLKFSETEVKAEQPSPMLGQHNEEILSKFLGYSGKEIADLEKEGVIVTTKE